MTPVYRAPSVKEAVHFLMDCYTREYRRRCLQFWQEHYGLAFAQQIETEFNKAFDARKRERKERR